MTFATPGIGGTKWMAANSRGRFWADVTPYEVGAVATARSYVESA